MVVDSLCKYKRRIHVSLYHGNPTVARLLIQLSRYPNKEFWPPCSLFGHTRDGSPLHSFCIAFQSKGFSGGHRSRVGAPATTFLHSERLTASSMNIETHCLHSKFIIALESIPMKRGRVAPETLLAYELYCNPLYLPIERVLGVISLWLDGVIWSPIRFVCRRSCLSSSHSTGIVACMAYHRCASWWNPDQRTIKRHQRVLPSCAEFARSRVRQG